MNKDAGGDGGDAARVNHPVARRAVAADIDAGLLDSQVQGLSQARIAHLGDVTQQRRDLRFEASQFAVLGRIANYSGKVVKWDEVTKKSGSEFPDNLAWDAPAPVKKDENGDYPIPRPGIYSPFA